MEEGKERKGFSRLPVRGVGRKGAFINLRANEIWTPPGLGIGGTQET